MRKNLLFLVFLTGLISCSQDDYIIENNSNETINEKKLKSAGDGRYDLLGYGYDITGEYLHPKSSRNQVINIDKLISMEKDKKPIDSIGTFTEYTDFYYGSNALDYIEEINRKIVSKNGGNNNSPLSALGGKLVGFTATLNIESESNLKKTFISRDSYAKSETVITVKGLNINRIPKELYQYLSEDFKLHLRTYTPQQLITSYGTHVLTDITLGGRLYSNFKSTYIEDNSYAYKRMHVKAGLNISLSKIGLNTDNESTNINIETLNKKNITQYLHIRTAGGSQGIDESYDFTTETPPKLNTTNWKNSVYANKGKGAALVEVNWEKAYPIYEFIEDPVKRDAVKNAVIKHIESKQFDIIECVPLIQWRNDKNNNTAYTIDPNHNYGSGWVKHGPICLVESKKRDGNTGLIQWANDRDKNAAYTIDPNYNYGSGWVKHGIICYVPINATNNTAPLIQWHNPQLKDTQYTIDPNYHYGTGWVRHGAICNAYYIKKEQ